jgi:ribulose kinase
MNKRGHEIKYLFMSGGLVKNPILMQLLADICQVPVQLPFSHSASVVLGSAMLGAIAYQEHSSNGDITSQQQAGQRGRNMSDELWSLMTKMSRPGSTVLPKEGNEKEHKLLEVKYQIFHSMIEQQKKFRKQVEEALA